MVIGGYVSVIPRTAQHLFGHFKVCMFVTLGLEICSHCGFLAMAVAEDRDIELVVWKRVW